MVSANANMRISSRGLDMIKKHEKLMLKAYMPTKNDVPTIGYGHTKDVKLGQVITEAEAEEFLREDVAWAEQAVRDTVKVKLNQNQFDALVSLVFNIGATNFRNSSVLRFINRGDFPAASASFLKWNKQRNAATGELVVLNGLTRRRTEESKLFLS